MSKNDITGDSIRSKPLSKEAEDNWDRIFRKPLSHDELVNKMLENPEVVKELSRMDIISQNGNDGLYYEPDDGQLTDEQYAKIKEYEYELNKSTSEVEKRFMDGISKPNGEQFGNRIKEQKLSNDDMLPEYELDKSTGELQKIVKNKGEQYGS